MNQIHKGCRSKSIYHYTALEYVVYQSRKRVIMYLNYAESLFGGGLNLNILFYFVAESPSPRNFVVKN